MLRRTNANKFICGYYWPGAFTGVRGCIFGRRIKWRIRRYSTSRIKGWKSFTNLAVPAKIIKEL